MIVTIRQPLRLLNTILDIFFPRECISCKKKDEFLCSDCLRNIPPPALDERNSKTVFASASYKSKVMKLAIKKLKYKNSKTLGKPLAKLVYERCIKTGQMSQVMQESAQNTSFCIIPVPLHKKKLRKRGYNQTEIIGKFLSDISSIEIYTNVLYKNSYSESQVDTQNREERIKNIAGSFSVRNTTKIKNKSVIVLDDVLTTGATMNEAIKTLKKAGIKNIYGIVVAM